MTVSFFFWLSLGVVLAAGGYPDSYAKGDVISGLPTDESRDSKVFHAGTQEKDGHTVTAGGRVLCACALGDNLQQAQEKAAKPGESLAAYKNFMWRRRSS